MAKYGDYLSVEDISSPFEAFGMTRDYKQSPFGYSAFYGVKLAD